MLERLNRYLEGSEKGVYVFLIWSFIGAVIGAVVGVVGITFHILLEEVTAFRMSHPWILFLLPLGGLVIAGLYHLLRMQNDRGTSKFAFDTADFYQYHHYSFAGRFCRQRRGSASDWGKHWIFYRQKNQAG